MGDENLCHQALVLSQFSRNVEFLPSFGDGSGDIHKYHTTAEFAKYECRMP